MGLFDGAVQIRQFNSVATARFFHRLSVRLHLLDWKHLDMLAACSWSGWNILAPLKKPRYLLIFHLTNVVMPIIYRVWTDSSFRILEQWQVELTKACWYSRSASRELLTSLIVFTFIVIWLAHCFSSSILLRYALSISEAASQLRSLQGHNKQCVTMLKTKLNQPVQ